MVRLRQIAYSLKESLLLLPLLFVLGAIALSRVAMTIDGRLEDERLPEAFTTTVDGGRAILTAIAGGLISSVTLLLSLVLVAVQLASSQFSPRTLHDWTGDRSQQMTIGLVLGTSVYCLLVLRETRSLGEGDALVPHLSVVLAVALGVISLIAVVRFVDQLTRSLRVGSVGRSITEQTIALVHRRGEHLVLEEPKLGPATPTELDPERDPGSDAAGDPPAGGEGPTEVAAQPDAATISAEHGGWVQQIDEDELLAALPDGSTAQLAISVGSYVFPRSPLAHVFPPPPDERCANDVRAAVALGPERTMQEDIGYGILQLVDVAVRALSPGINDPNTANDVIVNLGSVFLAIWEYPEEPALRSENGRSIIRKRWSHGEVLADAFGPLRRHGAADPVVVDTILRVLLTLRRETERRELAGPVEPIDDTIDAVVDAFERTEPAEVDLAPIRRLVADR